MEKNTAVPGRTVLQEPKAGDCEMSGASRSDSGRNERSRGQLSKRETGGHAGKRRKRRNETPLRA